jgi:DNA replication licensing factor MCM3
VVEEEDAELAIQLVQFAYFKKVLDRKGRKKGAEASDEEDEVEREDTPSKRRRVPSAEAEATPPSKKRPRVEAAGSQEEAGPSTSAAPAGTEARLKQFMALLQRWAEETS